MITISNMRKEIEGAWTYLKCDFSMDGAGIFDQDTMWLAVEEDMAQHLDDTTYDAFVLVPLMLGMWFHHDVHICGTISPRLYYNVRHYLMKIFDNFSDSTSPIRFTVDGTRELEGEPGEMVGTGISCGADSLVTIYDNFVMEDDPRFKITDLFLVNTGTHGDFGEEASRRWSARAELNRSAAEELGLPMHLVDSNFHAFTHKIGEQTIGYLAIWSCFVALQRGIRRYYVSSNLSYDEVAEFWRSSRSFDLSEYCEPYMPHLISTERFELVIDGCQYTRAEKVERISDWSFAQRHLNVCITPVDGAENCSCCEKCMWTLIPLEAMGKLDKFSQVFDTRTYRRHAKRFKLKFASNCGRDAMETSVVRYAVGKGLPMPPIPVAVAIGAARRAGGKVKRKLEEIDKR